MHDTELRTNIIVIHGYQASYGSGTWDDEHLNEGHHGSNTLPGIMRTRRGLLSEPPRQGVSVAM